MSRRNKTWLIAAGLLVTAMLISWFAYNGGTYTIEVTEKQAQEKIDTLLNKENLQQKLIKIESVRIHFENNQILLHARVLGVTRSRTLQADIQAQGIPQYRDGSFYLHPTVPITFSNIKVESSHKLFSETRKLIIKKLTNLLLSMDGKKSLKLSKQNSKRGELKLHRSILRPPCLTGPCTHLQTQKDLW